MNFNKLTNKRNGETFTKGTYNGIEVLRRDVDGYINATKMASDAGKQKHFSRFLQSQRMEEIIDYWFKNEVKSIYPNNGVVQKQGENEAFIFILI